jgi:hypothetical protein
LVAANSGRVPGELVRFAVRYFARRDQVRRTFLAAE